jgi:hypothetical protein
MIANMRCRPLALQALLALAAVGVLVRFPCGGQDAICFDNELIVGTFVGWLAGAALIVTISRIGIPYLAWVVAVLSTPTAWVAVIVYLFYLS